MHLTEFLLLLNTKKVPIFQPEVYVIQYCCVRHRPWSWTKVQLPFWSTGLKPHHGSINDWVSWASKQWTRLPTEFDVPRKGLGPTYRVTFAVGNRSQSEVMLHTTLQIWLGRAEGDLASDTLQFQKHDPPMQILPLIDTQPQRTTHTTKSDQASSFVLKLCV